MTLSVLHLVGSPVSEFYADVSRLYAADCLAATADPRRYVFHVAHVAPGGRWSFPADLTPAGLSAAPTMSLPEALTRLEVLAVDVAVPQMFCLPGMTHYRSLLDVLGIAYLGNRPDVMALGADKARTSAVVAGAGVVVPDSAVCRPGDPPPLPAPVVVKAVDADNSLGLTLLGDDAALEAGWSAALDEAAAADSAGRALVETYVELGREVRCGVLDVRGELVCLPLEEYAVDAVTKPVRDRADKLRRTEDGDLALVAKDAEHAWILAPGDVPDPITAAVHDAALACYRALGCRHYGLFDFRIDPDGVPHFLEAGLYCSYARSSVVAVMARAAGIDLPELFALAVQDATSGPGPRPTPTTTATTT